MLSQCSDLWQDVVKGRGHLWQDVVIKGRGHLWQDVVKGRGHLWQDVVKGRGHLWQDVVIKGRGHLWQDVVKGRGHLWQDVGRITNCMSTKYPLRGEQIPHWIISLNKGSSHKKEKGLNQT